MKKTLILLGGNLYQGRGYQKEKFDYVIAADGGLIAAEKMGILPTHIVGDFDTVPKEMVDFYQKKNIPVRIFQPEKDMTDVQIAVEMEVEYQREEIYIGRDWNTDGSYPWKYSVISASFKREYSLLFV